MQQRNQVSADTHLVEYIPFDAGEHFLMVSSHQAHETVPAQRRSAAAARNGPGMRVQYQCIRAVRHATQRSAAQPRERHWTRIGQCSAAPIGRRCGSRTTTTLEPSGSRRMHRRAARKLEWRHAFCAVEWFVCSFEVALFCVAAARYFRYAGGMITPTIAFPIESDNNAPECVELALRCVIRACAARLYWFTATSLRGASSASNRSIHLVLKRSLSAHSKAARRVLAVLGGMLNDPTLFTAGGLRIVVVCRAVGVRCTMHDTTYLMPHSTCDIRHTTFHLHG
jgi:hypothetical protein